MSDHTKWTDEAILEAVSAKSVRAIVSTGISSGEPNRWLIDSGDAHNIALQIRDDMAQEIARLQAENAALKQGLAAAKAKIEQLESAPWWGGGQNE